MLTGETVKTQPDWSMVHLFMLESLSGQPFYAMRQSARRLKERKMASSEINRINFMLADTNRQDIVYTSEGGS